MALNPHELLLSAMDKAPQESMRLIFHGLQTGYLNAGSAKAEEKSFLTRLLEKTDAPLGGRRSFSRLAYLTEQPAKKWVEITGPDAWVTGAKAPVMAVLEGLADYQKALKADSSTPRPTFSPQRWFEDLMTALPGFPSLSEAERMAALEKSIQLDSETAILSLLNKEDLLNPTQDGEKLRRALRHARNLWPHLLALGIEHEPVRDRPFWFAVLETAGENGVSNVNVKAIETWAFETGAWSGLAGPAKDRAVTWLQKTLPVRLQSPNSSHESLMMWLANTPAKWHTVRGLNDLTSQKAQALRILAQQHHHLWEVPAHLGRVDWHAMVSEHPVLGLLARATPEQHVEIRTAAHAFISQPNKQTQLALIESLNHRDMSTLMPGLWQMAMGHAHVASIDWKSLFGKLEEKRSEGVRQAWQGADPDQVYRDGLLQLFPSGKRFDENTLTRRIQIMASTGDHTNARLAQQWQAIFMGKKGPAPDVALWTQETQADPHLKAALQITLKAFAKDPAKEALHRFHKAMSLDLSLPDSRQTEAPKPRF